MEQNCQTEKVFKAAYKYIIDNGYRKLSQVEKDLIKNAIDEAKTFEELLAVVATMKLTRRNHYYG